MPQSLSKVLLHVVFSTKNRAPFLRDPALRAEMHRYLGGILTKLDCLPLSIGGVEDHVHLLFILSRTQTIADIIKEVKRGSSVWIKQRSQNLGDFAWQTGYGVFSIGFSQKDAVIAYIAVQEEHHRKIYQDEFRALLQRYEIPFDEKLRLGLRAPRMEPFQGSRRGRQTRGSARSSRQPRAEVCNALRVGRRPSLFSTNREDGATAHPTARFPTATAQCL